jgi:cystathionine gamma-synthase
VLERNSRDYLERSVTLNNNAHKVASILQSKATDPASSVSKVNYPSVSPTGHSFVPFMRAPTDEFTPGYGSLLSVEFDELDQMIAFYEALQVHFGPHLGAPLSLALPYNNLIFYRTPEDEAKAKANGWTMNQIRLAVGLENTEELVEMVKQAVDVADEGQQENFFVDPIEKWRNRQYFIFRSSSRRAAIYTCHAANIELDIGLVCKNIQVCLIYKI